MFYIYEWYIEETNEIIYVGKGNKKRYLSKQHNSMFKEFIKRYNCKSRIIEYFDNEQTAYEKEFERINELKLKDQCVCNIRNGGAGGGASKKTKMKRWTVEERKRYSEFNVMKTQNQRERMKKNNPMKNKEYVEKLAMKKRKTIQINNEEYCGWAEVAKAYGMKNNVIGYWLKKGTTNKGETIKYK